MNRRQRRDLAKLIRKRDKRVSAKEAEAYVAIINNADAIRSGGAGEISPPQPFEEGDKVVLNIERIKSRKNYDRMAEAYKEFVESSEGVVFTAHVERENMISMDEDPRWLFWSGDLEHADDTEES